MFCFPFRWNLQVSSKGWLRGWVEGRLEVEHGPERAKRSRCKEVRLFVVPHALAAVAKGMHEQHGPHARSRMVTVLRSDRVLVHDQSCIEARLCVGLKLFFGCFWAFFILLLESSLERDFEAFTRKTWESSILQSIVKMEDYSPLIQRLIHVRSFLLSLLIFLFTVLGVYLCSLNWFSGLFH